MNEEEKKAIEDIKYLIEDFKRHREKTLDKEFDDKQIDMFITILNLIEKQQQELQLKDKVIEEMAEMLVKVPDNADNPTAAVVIEMINRNLEIKKRQVIQYVINKVKGE